MSLLPDIGDKFSGCEIIARCGKGAFGITFLARNPLGQKVIIKIVSSSSSCERELTGLRNYMRVAGKHPNLLQIYHIGELEEGFYYTMEAADNADSGNSYHPATLGNYFRQKRIFSPGEALDITRQLAGALKVMHAADLIHRDIKPDNIIFVNGQPKLSDPGLVVTVGEEASFAGTLGFVPPEIIDEEGLPDQRADIYALGKVFYCMVTGYHPKQYPALPMDMRVEVCRQLYPVLNRMCNRNPQKRYLSAAELLENLPIELSSPNFIEKLREDFKLWRQLNFRKYQLIKKMTAALLLLMLLALGTCGMVQYYARQRHQTFARAIEEFEAINRDRRDMLELQLQTYLPETAEIHDKLYQLLNHARQDKNWNNADIFLKKLHSHLQLAARMLIPELPKTQDRKHLAAAVGNMYGFLASPLAEYLPENERQALKKKLKAAKAALYANDKSVVRCGEDLNGFQDYYLPLKFVPPGVVKMAHNNRTERIDYHYWIGIQEVTNEHFNRTMGFAPQKHQNSTNPVERVSWNDILYYCYAVTVSWQQQNLLPPGYIIRPPTEIEWEYAANNAWMGKDTLPLEERANIKSNSQNRPWPAGRKAPSKLGLLDIYGNVSEIVKNSYPTKMQQAIVTRGGSYLSTPKSPRNRYEYLKYQNIPFDIGFRVVLAPGDMSYFDREFFAGGPVQTRSRGKIYELIGCNVGVFTPPTADALCQLLGCSLAEIEDQDHLDELKKSIPLLGAWNTLLGGVRSAGGQWIWPHSKRPIRFGQWRTPSDKQKGDRLTLVKKKWCAAANCNIALMLCQWSEEQYGSLASRVQKLPTLPLEKYRFTYNGRQYILLQLYVHWLTARRICELLGGRLAVLSDPAVEKHVRSQLKNFGKYRIWLGGYAKREKCYYLDGSEFSGTLITDDTSYLPSRNINYLQLRNDHFYSGKAADLILLELPPASAAVQ